MLIQLSLLDADPKNPNVCSTATMEKLKRNIERTGLCPPLIVRPHKKRYIIIDGHHRKQVLDSLGWIKAECQVWDVSEQEAKIALATLNRLCGTDIPQKRAELIESLIQSIPIDDLSDLIPETSSEIEDLLSLLQLDTDAMEQALAEQISKEKASLPVPLTFLVEPHEAEIIEQVLTYFFDPSQRDRGKALLLLCEFALPHLTEGKKNGPSQVP